MWEQHHLGWNDFPSLLQIFVEWTVLDGSSQNNSWKAAIWGVETSWETRVFTWSQVQAGIAYHRVWNGLIHIDPTFRRSREAQPVSNRSGLLVYESKTRVCSVASCYQRKRVLAWIITRSLPTRACSSLLLISQQLKVPQPLWNLHNNKMKKGFLAAIAKKTVKQTE